ncbi:acetoin utilization protein AcuC [soil metagenome]
MSGPMRSVRVFAGAELARYGFGADHPFGPDRHDVFLRELEAEGLDARVQCAAPRRADVDEIAAFHAPAYIDWVRERSAAGVGFLDGGDTPAMPGIFEAGLYVVGATVQAVEDIMAGACRRAFVPIGGLHHGRRDAAAGFCVFNDCGVAIEMLRRRHGLARIAYIDIDAHHGDGVFYSFEDDPSLIFADIHEDGRFLYPGTGSADETGRGAARGTKLNVPLPPGADDEAFAEAWAQVERHVDAAAPEFILLQCGADSLAGDPITHLEFTEESHALAARRVCEIARRHCGGRVLAMGGGGYNRRNLARAWTRVVRELVEAA